MYRPARAQTAPSAASGIYHISAVYRSAVCPSSGAVVCPPRHWGPERVGLSAPAMSSHTAAFRGVCCPTVHSRIGLHPSAASLCRRRRCRRRHVVLRRRREPWPLSPVAADAASSLFSTTPTSQTPSAWSHRHLLLCTSFLKEMCISLSPVAQQRENLDRNTANSPSSRHGAVVRSAHRRLSSTIRTPRPAKEN
jgi:hypothetical protein